MSFKKVKISAVSYSNTYPFLYGINKKLESKYFELSLDVPSECARKLINNEVDLGLIPVATIPLVENSTIISNYCIGANGAVKTVLLMSKVPIDKINKVYLDTESRTSAQLLKTLAKEYWKNDWEYENLPENFASNNNVESILLIGDKTQKDLPYNYTYDLALEWQKFTKMPFVFAAWVSNKPLSTEFITKFNSSIEYGINNIPASIKAYNKEHRYNLEEYLTKYISYAFDKDKQEALLKFLSFMY